MPALPTEDLKHILAHTRDLWAEARGKAFFITGGTGFFGMWLLESFAYANDRLQLGAKAVVLTRNSKAFLQKAPHLMSRQDIALFEGDVRSFAFIDGSFPYVIHAATEATAKLNEKAPHEMLDVIVNGTQRVLRFAAQAGVSKMLLVSSGAVYGTQPPELERIKEDYSGALDPTGRSSAYGEGKRISEALSIAHAKKNGYQIKVARCFAFVGPHLPLSGHFAIGNFMRDGLAGEEIKVLGDGTPRRSYLYSADLAIWLWTLLFKGKTGEAYNVGSSDAYPLREVAEKVATFFHSKVCISVKADPATAGRPSRYVPEVQKAFHDLNLRPFISLDEALLRTAAWHGRKPTALSQGNPCLNANVKEGIEINKRLPE